MKLDGTELYHAMLHQLEKSAIHLSEEEDKRSKEKEDEEENLASKFENKKSSGIGGNTLAV